MKKITIVTILLFGHLALAQIGIGNTDPKATLDISTSNVATPTPTDGILIPRIDDFPATNPGFDQDGMLVYSTGASGPAKGFYYWRQGIGWVSISGNTLDEAYDQGGTGAGRTITASNGAVLINGTDGFQTTGTVGSGATMALAGAGTKMFFYPRKAAFRAGFVNGTQWNDASIGNYSAAFGFNNTASGNYSAAFGRNNTVVGTSSVVFGEGNASNGAFNFVSGTSSVATGENAFAVGENVNADGDLSIAMGSASTANRNSSVVIGANVESFSAYETVMGLNSTTYTPTTPNGFNNNDRLFVIGNGANISDRSNALTIYKDGRMNINDAYTMPTTDGTIDQVLTTDGNGIASWQDAQSTNNLALTQVRMGSQTTVASPGLQKVNFTSTSGMFDLNSNFNDTTDRFEVTSTGYYRINASIRCRTISNVPAASYTLLLRVGSIMIKRKVYDSSGGNFEYFHLEVNKIVRLVATEYVEINIITPNSVQIDTADFYSVFEIQQVR